MCGVCLEFRINQLGTQVPLEFFFLLNLVLDLSLCQERQEGNKRFNVCILGTRTREKMNESRISRAVVVAASSLIVWGS